jgi:hypothetical protein
MPTTSKISSLRRKRDSCLSKIQLITENIDKYQQSSTHDVNILKTYNKRTEENWNRIRLAYEELNDLDEEENSNELEAFNNYLALEARLMNPIEGDRTATPSKPIGSEAPATTVRLPEMRLPTLDGTLENWSSFHNAFSLTIDNIHHLTPVQKFQYLRSTLTGETADCINAIILNNANYNDTLALLKEKFECLRHTALCLNRALIKYPEITKESPEALRHLIDTIKQNLRSLNNLGESTNANSLLLNLITSKLPPHIVKQWDLTLPNKEVPQYTHLLDFLEKLALSSISTSAVTATRKWLDQLKPVRQY